MNIFTGEIRAILDPLKFYLQNLLSISFLRFLFNFIKYIRRIKSLKMYRYYGTSSLIGIKIRQLKPERKNWNISLTFYVIFILYKFYFTSQNHLKDKEVETVLNYYNLFSPQKKISIRNFRIFRKHFNNRSLLSKTIVVIIYHTTLR